MPRDPLSTERIVDEALQLMLDSGCRTIRFNAVARRLGVKPPALYNHVDSLHDLESLVSVRCWELLLAHLRPPDASEVPTVATLSRRMRAFVQAHPCAYNHAHQHPPRPEDPRWKSVQDGLDDLVQHLGQAASGAEGRHRVRAALSLVHGFVELESSGLWNADLSADASFEWLLSEALMPLLAPAPPPQD